MNFSTEFFSRVSFSLLIPSLVGLCRNEDIMYISAFGAFYCIKYFVFDVRYVTFG